YLLCNGAHDRQREVDAERLAGLFPDGRPSAAVDEEHAAAIVGQPAVEAIRAAALGARVMMVNEEHQASVQRAFLQALLEPLRRDGFTHLACETFADDIATSTSAGYPLRSSGTYTQDPYLGDAVRQALALGYTLVPYEAEAEHRAARPEDESPLDPTNRREARQAERIAEFLSAHPGSRLLVYAGRHHISELATTDGWKPMASQLGERWGIDPVTVDLITLCEQADPKYEQALYRWLTKQGVVKDEPLALFDADGKTWKVMEGLDLFIAFPRATWTQGRPSYLRWRTGRRSVAIPLGDVKRDVPLLVRACVEGEAADAVPLDQVIVWPHEEVPALLLRPATYRLEIVDADGLVRKAEVMEVKV
ncbi:MAG TPA: hypothetical protein VK824_09220, partial [Planctomycetota bacterium]|nr:hypothetical protein [Planctomycetota bacterium]